ncbi:hypothetical protein C4D60_Mb07t11510 [Musa balbisiana]|uniref:Uncharacterized protein n=1 Tax=Musa balbisiana TaxID=52838 RepID=A0A4S8JES9_MUSBA|nr:hypothetical protein C4D60_Mb07t11510 [Musa balbisiana]
MGISLLSTVYQLPELNRSNLGSSVSLLMFNWCEFSFSSFTRGWTPTAFRWPTITFSVIDDIVWAFVMVTESVALGAMLCFFYVFCGCSV